MATQNQDPFTPWQEAVRERDNLIVRWTARAQYFEERAGILEDYYCRQAGVTELPTRNSELRRLLRGAATPEDTAPAETPPSPPAAPPEDSREEEEGEAKEDEDDESPSSSDPPPKRRGLKSFLDLRRLAEKPK